MPFVTVPAFPVTLPEIGLVTVRFPSVPTLVRLDTVTPLASVLPVIPLAGTEVAVMVPDPVAPKVAPVPTTIAAEVLVPLVMLLKALLPPPEHVNVPPDSEQPLPTATTEATPLLL